MKKSPMPQHGDDFLMRNTDSPDWHPMPVFCDFISLQAVPVIVKKKEWSAGGFALGTVADAAT